VLLKRNEMSQIIISPTSIQVNYGVLVMSLSGSFLQKISAATDHLCQIVLKQNNAKRNCIKQDLCNMVMDG